MTDWDAMADFLEEAGHAGWAGMVRTEKSRFWGVRNDRGWLQWSDGRFIAYPDRRITEEQAAGLNRQGGGRCWAAPFEGNEEGRQ